ncbi:hypothetical protein chiPu_0009369 [Chiloscyllium punctatum]|uniref:lysoplasmalogenase n=2 Tax=Chiloscyllium punctatum TaxID=137246 RepID=A0A401SKJ0_CHIPU|nr:hypothetical protein [Chiloscyllium punctatum]
MLRPLGLPAVNLQSRDSSRYPPPHPGDVTGPERAGLQGGGIKTKTEANRLRGQRQKRSGLAIDIQEVAKRSRARRPGTQDGERMVSPVTVVKNEGPKLVPFFKATCVYFVLWLPTSSPSWFSALIKCLPIFCLWVFLLAHGINFLGTRSNARKILAGLIFSALGDAFLIWQEQGYFVHGLLMFAITHILYTSAFGMKPLNPEPGCGVVVICGISYCLLYPYLSGPFTYLVAVYIALIGFMGWRAIAGVQLFNDLWTWTKLCACLGAVLFMVSDLTIAVNKFCFPVPYSRAIIMATYYAAQMLISLSVVECKDDNDRNVRKMN